jgi:hypothetical protein
MLEDGGWTGGGWTVKGARRAGTAREYIGDMNWYAKPAWQRILYSLVFSIVVTPLTVAIFTFTDPAGLFDLEASWETVLWALVFIAAVSALMFVTLVFMFEYWWRRHPPDWMIDDEGSSNMHLPDVRG